MQGAPLCSCIAQEVYFADSVPGWVPCTKLPAEFSLLAVPGTCEDLSASTSSFTTWVVPKGFLSKIMIPKLNYRNFKERPHNFQLLQNMCFE